MRKKLALCAVLFAWTLIWVPQLQALTIGTFNMEYFTVKGGKAYTSDDCAHLAKLIETSGADLLALQEIVENRSLEYLLDNYLPQWSYTGNQTEGKQNLFFIWNKNKINITTPIEPLFTEDTINWGGKVVPLFRRHPIKATFREVETGAEFSVINVHLRSLGTAGSKDRLAAVAMNNGIRQAQVIKLNHAAEEEKGPLFILGDFNSVEVTGATFPFFPLTEEHSYDDFQCTIDHIGYVNLAPSKNWRIRVIETSIPRRSVGGRQHPDHDIVVLSMPDLLQSNL
ncbi:endonuclease/exonuclease/phosphatase family protein [Dethiosulfovibrio salsuginis]|uniref:Endonuclease/Exonuclease/phosphatase family protein n=1 Tax=Dethiosulfovibrio salsuginis TaxID=561720 RepID=A0A1X7IX66_9BACT|nr:endonuclease/exonuclease/phosphatase family protein [Dethiosulfovibrio salsuginis]SMG19503.1 Endonuclease/Exonuclease/phosphatase family protein [Dethiosulfovibrio salsuginis]